MLEFKPLADWQEQNTDHKSWVTSAGQCSITEISSFPLRHKVSISDCELFIYHNVQIKLFIYYGTLSCTK